ncbi:DUF5941 domain-containing protein [Streptomyces thermolineatus]|uniref:DUF5941 domain-containing protein n=1 Tax=Streptomyces thermolineatus TaxID=44033 RepID=UPI00384B4514
MSTAILTGPPVAESPLEDDLRSLGYDVVGAAGPDELRERIAAAPARGRVAVVDRRFVGHLHALRLTLADPRFTASAAPGVLVVDPVARPALEAAVVRAGAVLPDVLVDFVEAEGVVPRRPELGVLVAGVPADGPSRAEAEGAVAAVDGEKVRLRSAVKARDGFTTTFLVSPYSKYLARWCARRGFTPNQVTTASLLVALVAAGFAATGTRTGFAVSGVLLMASFVLDCTDGQLARYALKYSKLGAWLDATFDRAKEYAYYAGLALGAARGGDDVWALALGAMVLQTCRHVVDFSFNEADRPAAAAGGAGPGPAGPQGPGASPAAALSARLDKVGWTVWLRRMVVLPIGERWLMIAVLAALTTPRTTFTVLLAAGALAACYTTAGRVLRSVNRRTPRTPEAARALADLADTGPVAAAVARVPAPRAVPAPVWAAAGTAALLLTVLLTGTGSWWAVAAAGGYALLSGAAVSRPLDGRLDWLAPPLFRTAEYTTVLVLAARSEVNGALPAAFGLVAAVAYHHYDTVYRIRGGTGAPPVWLVRAIGGHEGRVLLVTAVVALTLGHGTVLTLALAVLAGALALAVLTESIRFWVSSAAPAVHDESGEPQ